MIIHYNHSEDNPLISYYRSNIVSHYPINIVFFQNYKSQPHPMIFDR